MPYEITKCYLPPGSGENPAFTPAEAGTRFSNPKRIQGWVDLCYVKADQPGIKHAACKSQVQRSIAKPSVTQHSIHYIVDRIIQMPTNYMHFDRQDATSFTPAPHYKQIMVTDKDYYTVLTVYDICWSQ